MHFYVFFFERSDLQDWAYFCVRACLVSHTDFGFPKSISLHCIIEKDTSEQERKMMGHPKASI